VPTKVLPPLGCPAPLVRDATGKCVPRGLSAPLKGDSRSHPATVPPVIKVPPKALPPVKQTVKPSVIVKPEVKHVPKVKEHQKPRIREAPAPAKKPITRSAPAHPKPKQAVPQKKDVRRTKQP
jgi:hypothetical protein